MVELATVNRAVVGSSPTLGASAHERWQAHSGRGRGASTRLGASSEIEVVAALRRAGYRVSVPVMDGGSPYDCIIDDGRELKRVQIKTGFVTHGAVRWATRSTSYHRRNGGARQYHGLADVFAVWVPEMSRCYLVPVSECGRSQAALRLAPARNGQRRNTRAAESFELRALGRDG